MSFAVFIAAHTVIPDPVLQRLKEEIEQIESSRSFAHVALPFTLSAIDTHLPHGGLIHGALHDVRGGDTDAMHGAAAALFVAGIAARINGPVLWCLTRRDLFAPGLASVGLTCSKVIYVEAGSDSGVLLAMEEGLRHAGLAAVIGEVRHLPIAASRRLQLAAETSGVMAFTIRRWLKPRDDAVAVGPSAAVTRWQITASPSSPGNLGRAQWNIILQRCRGGMPGAWIMEACDAQGRLAVPADMANRSAQFKQLRIAA